MATDCSSIDLSALVNAAQSAAKDFDYKNPKEKQLEVIVYTFPSMSQKWQLKSHYTNVSCCSS